MAAGIGSVVAAPIAINDNFNDRIIDQDRIGNNWTWYDSNYESDCTTSVGGFGPYSEGGGGFANYVHPNNNYAQHGDNGAAYFRAGLESQGEGDIALNVYQNQYATQACNEIKIFQEFAGGDFGTYQINVNVIGNEFTAISEGSSVGLFFKVLDVDADYSETQFEKYPITPPAHTAADLAVEVQFTVDDAASNRIVQVGMYAQHPNGGTASAIWDDFSISAVTQGNESVEAVSNADANTGDESVQLVWTPLAGPSAVPSAVPNPGDAWVIQWKPDLASLWNAAVEIDGALTSYTVDGLTNGTPYVFRIARSVDGDFSAWTTVGPVTPSAPPPPPEPEVDATPVPSLPLWGLFGLVGLLGLIGARARR